MKRPQRKSRKEREIIDLTEETDIQPIKTDSIEEVAAQTISKIITEENVFIKLNTKEAIIEINDIKEDPIKTVKSKKNNIPPTKKSKSIFDPDSNGYNWLKNKIPDEIINPIATQCFEWYNKNKGNLKETELL